MLFNFKLVYIGSSVWGFGVRSWLVAFFFSCFSVSVFHIKPTRTERCCFVLVLWADTCPLCGLQNLNITVCSNSRSEVLSAFYKLVEELREKSIYKLKFIVWNGSAYYFIFIRLIYVYVLSVPDLYVQLWIYPSCHSILVWFINLRIHCKLN